MPSHIIVSGSHGNLTVHRTTGIILQRIDHSVDDDPYSDIAWFDPICFSAEPRRDSFDILETGYWTRDGSYEPRLTVRTCTKIMCEFEDWVPFAMLPAPDFAPPVGKEVVVKPRTRTGSYNCFERRYRPVEQADGSIMVDSFHEVRKMLPERVRFLWTIVEAERLYLVPGWHYVNRIGYVWAENPWSDIEAANPPYAY